MILPPRIKLQRLSTLLQLEKALYTNIPSSAGVFVVDVHCTGIIDNGKPGKFFSTHNHAVFPCSKGSRAGYSDFFRFVELKMLCCSCKV